MANPFPRPRTHCARPRANTTAPPSRGKISVTPTKPLRTSATCRWPTRRAWPIPASTSRRDPALAADFTSRGNLVGVVTNGTAVLGLGDIGPLAAKPVMEGKGCLFKKFAGIDVFDIELAERDPDKLVEIIAALEPTLGGINLEDIKAPECFYIEKTAARAHEHPGVPRRPARHRHHLEPRRCINGLELVGKNIERREGRGVGRRRRGHRLPGRDGRPGRQAEPTSSSVDSKGVIHERPRRQARRLQAALRPEDAGAARWPTWSRTPTCSSAARPPAC